MQNRVLAIYDGTALMELAKWKRQREERRKRTQTAWPCNWVSCGYRKRIKEKERKEKKHSKDSNDVPLVPYTDIYMYKCGAFLALRKNTGHQPRLLYIYDSFGF